MYACSDLRLEVHSKWLMHLPPCAEPNSVLLVAGDVHCNLARLEVNCDGTGTTRTGGVR